MTTTVPSNHHHYDFCIIGSGPAGLATLSALRETYTLGNGIHMNDISWHVRNLSSRSQQNSNKKRNQQKRICVIDPHPQWMEGWKNNFDLLDINFLRSPVLAHPDSFDPNSLLAYAYSQNRQNELYESDCSNNKKLFALGESQVGLWDLPSTSLFNNFCMDLSNRLEHDYICGEVADINDDDTGCNEEDEEDKKKLNNNNSQPFRLTINGRENEKPIIISANAVILALGTIGKPIIPRGLKSLPDSKLCHWQQLHENKLLQQTNNNCRTVLVVGGGLTAIQTAQFVLAKCPTNTKVVLCSRRIIQEKAFDVSDTWFDRRHSNRQISNFYHCSESERLQILKGARGGGSVPPMYMNSIRPYIKNGRLKLVEGEAIFNDRVKEKDNSSSRVSITIDGRRGNKFSDNKDTYEFDVDLVLLACGIEPDCNHHPLIQCIQRRWPLETIGGFPCVSEDLQWREDLCVVGSLSSLNTGPDAANLMGIKRSAGVVANTLGCRSWLRDEGDDIDVERKGGGVLTNQFRYLQWDEESDSMSCSSSDGDDNEKKDCGHDLLVVE